MSAVKLSTIGIACASVLLGSATLGCAAGAANTPAPSSALGAAAPSQAACFVGSPRVVAPKVAPRAGVESEGDWSRVWLRFARTPNSPVAVALEPATLAVLGESDSSPASLPAAAVAFRAPWVVTSTAPQSESGPMRASSPVVAGVDAERAVFAWTEGSIYTGLDVRVWTVDGEHPLGMPITLPHTGSAIGRPTVAFASPGRGVVAFIESNGSGFQLVAASLDCRAPHALQASAMVADRAAE